MKLVQVVQTPIVAAPLSVTHTSSVDPVLGLLQLTADQSVVHLRDFRKGSNAAAAAARYATKETRIWMWTVKRPIDERIHERITQRSDAKRRVTELHSNDCFSRIASRNMEYDYLQCRPILRSHSAFSPSGMSDDMVT